VTSAKDQVCKPPGEASIGDVGPLFCPQLISLPNLPTSLGPGIEQETEEGGDVGKLLELLNNMCDDASSSSDCFRSGVLLAFIKHIVMAKRCSFNLAEFSSHIRLLPEIINCPDGIVQELDIQSNLLGAQLRRHAPTSGGKSSRKSKRPK
jgi:hypothetical protein